MIDRIKALQIATDEVHSLASDADDEFLVQEDLTQETGFGWIFFYQSKHFLESQDHRFALAGNAPLLVDKRTERVVALGTAYPLETYLALYERGEWK
jgi:hypothetical protein